MENGANGECLKIADERSRDEIVEFHLWTTNAFFLLTLSLLKSDQLFGRYTDRLN